MNRKQKRQMIKDFNKTRFEKKFNKKGELVEGAFGNAKKQKTTMKEIPKITKRENDNNRKVIFSKKNRFKMNWEEHPAQKQLKKYKNKNKSLRVYA